MFLGGENKKVIETGNILLEYGQSESDLRCVNMGYSIIGQVISQQAISLRLLNGKREQFKLHQILFSLLLEGYCSVLLMSLMASYRKPRKS